MHLELILMKACKKMCVEDAISRCVFVVFISKIAIMVKQQIKAWLNEWLNALVSLEEASNKPLLLLPSDCYCLSDNNIDLQSKIVS